ncbi:hypothetical protein, partial [Streptomyces sp. NPDC059008]|uniref:hypothetical protein n=1 Tax=Streptomyces sp. NPDC059008 TaxID=3346693 RepID=UPI003688459D
DRHQDVDLCAVDGRQGGGRGGAPRQRQGGGQRGGDRRGGRDAGPANDAMADALRRAGLLGKERGGR